MNTVACETSAGFAREFRAAKVYVQCAGGEVRQITDCPAACRTRGSNSARKCLVWRLATQEDNQWRAPDLADTRPRRVWFRANYRLVRNRALVRSSYFVILAVLLRKIACNKFSCKYWTQRLSGLLEHRRCVRPATCVLISTVDTQQVCFGIVTHGPSVGWLTLLTFNLNSDVPGASITKSVGQATLPCPVARFGCAGSKHPDWAAPVKPWARPRFNALSPDSDVPEASFPIGPHLSNRGPGHASTPCRPIRMCRRQTRIGAGRHPPLASLSRKLHNKDSASLSHRAVLRDARPAVFFVRVLHFNLPVSPSVRPNSYFLRL